MDETIHAYLWVQYRAKVTCHQSIFDIILILI